VSAAIAGFYEGIDVAHVEAGLRTHDLSAPFPEEGNRQLISRIATMHFAPTQRNRDVLVNEGISPDRIWVTGNTVIDALMWTVGRIAGDAFPADLSEFNSLRLSLQRLSTRVILVTGHRRESFGSGINSICRALLRIANTHPDIQIIYPVHLNPAVVDQVHKSLEGRPNIHLLPPLSYPSFVWLMRRAYLIITDSGGVQEEAPSIKRPVLVTRRLTEREEVIEAGAVKVVGFSEENIVSEVDNLLSSTAYYSKFIVDRNPYGDGAASEQIVRLIKFRFASSHLSDMKNGHL
jgi:UDP-N-acetylglucosamine 2-epimerase (non-hydrolysing)